jgi:putative phosphoesterase
MNRDPDDGSHLVGIISDTHGLLRPSVLKVFDGVELILHAGDVGGDEILDELAVVAPVEAVYGNCDAPGDPRLQSELVRSIGGLTVHVSHGHELGAPTPKNLLTHYPHDVLIYGHTHSPLVARAGGRLVVNPGAAGPRRFKLEPSVARLTIKSGHAEVELIELE